MESSNPFVFNLKFDDFDVNPQNDSTQQPQNVFNISNPFSFQPNINVGGSSTEPQTPVKGVSQPNIFGSFGVNASFAGTPNDANPIEEKKEELVLSSDDDSTISMNDDSSEDEKTTKKVEPPKEIPQEELMKMNFGQKPLVFAEGQKSGFSFDLNLGNQFNQTQNPKRKIEITTSPDKIEITNRDEDGSDDDSTISMNDDSSEDEKPIKKVEPLKEIPQEELMKMSFEPKPFVFAEGQKSDFVFSFDMPQPQNNQTTTSLDVGRKGALEKIAFRFKDKKIAPANEKIDEEVARRLKQAGVQSFEIGPNFIQKFINNFIEFAADISSVDEFNEKLKPYIVSLGFTWDDFNSMFQYNTVEDFFEQFLESLK